MTDTDTAISVFLPDWLREAATAAALKQGQSLDDMLRLIAYEYVENHAPEKLSLQRGEQEQIPIIVRMANAVLVNAIDKQMSEVRLVPHAGGLSVVPGITLADATLFDLPAHLKPQLYDRFVRMASREAFIPERAGSFEITSKGKAYQVRLTWDGDYRSEMTLQILPV